MVEILGYSHGNPVIDIGTLGRLDTFSIKYEI
jgi:hypothetical protein